MNLNAKVLAVRLLDFYDDKQQHVHGYQIFVSAVTDQAGWTNNVELMKCWVPMSSELALTAAALIPGDPVVISFNRRGKPILVSAA